jgi:hypothetical protein
LTVAGARPSRRAISAIERALLVAVVASERRRSPPPHDTGLDGHQR